MFIIRCRPNLENTITGIITAIHSGEGIPEELYEKQKKIANAPFRKRMMIAMTRVRNIYDEDYMFAYAVKETENSREWPSPSAMTLILPWKSLNGKQICYCTVPLTKVD